jgi:hypothetical protein
VRLKTKGFNKRGGRMKQNCTRGHVEVKQGKRRGTNEIQTFKAT